MKPRYLLDTNVISETRRGRADARVLAFLESAEVDSLFMSVLTMGELRKGVALRHRHDPLAAGHLDMWVNGIETMFADRVLPIDMAAARIWGDLSAIRPLPVIDGLIAATALAGGLTLVTRNVRDFADTGVSVLNPWQAD